MNSDLLHLLEEAIALRAPRIANAAHENAFRLFNGFYEGDPSLAIDIYGRTLLIHDYAEGDNAETREQVIAYLRNSLNWLRAGIIKQRNSPIPQARRGVLAFGNSPDEKIREHGVWHAIDLTMNQDASFYLDTETLRAWLIANSREKRILNFFAYTGSLGTAARYGGAAQVAQVDLNRKFLGLAQKSYALNSFPLRKGEFIPRDFFEQVGSFKRGGVLFDTVILDPPFFSETGKGKINQEQESARLINKVRPLVADGGIILAVNNALYLSGAEYMQTLQALCADGYLSIRELIPAPQDFIGNKKREAVCDPAPFNHSTKIVVLDVKRKAGQA